MNAYNMMQKHPPHLPHTRLAQDFIVYMVGTSAKIVVANIFWGCGLGFVKEGYVVSEMCFGLLQEIIQGCLTIFTEEYTVLPSEKQNVLTNGWELLSFEEDMCGPP